MAVAGATAACLAVDGAERAIKEMKVLGVRFPFDRSAYSGAAAVWSRCRWTSCQSWIPAHRGLENQSGNPSLSRSGAAWTQVEDGRRL